MKTMRCQPEEFKPKFEISQTSKPRNTHPHLPNAEVCTSSTADEATAEDPMAEKPEEISEKPKAIAGQTTAEKAKETAAKPKAEKAKAQKPKAEKQKAEKPKAEKLKAEKLKAEKGKAEKGKAEKPKAEKARAEKPKAARQAAKEATAKQPTAKGPPSPEADNTSFENTSVEDLPASIPPSLPSPRSTLVPHRSAATVTAAGVQKAPAFWAPCTSNDSISASDTATGTATAAGVQKAEACSESERWKALLSLEGSKSTGTPSNSKFGGDLHNLLEETRVPLGNHRSMPSKVESGHPPMQSEPQYSLQPQEFPLSRRRLDRQKPWRGHGDSWTVSLDPERDEVHLQCSHPSSNLHSRNQESGELCGSTVPCAEEFDSSRLAYQLELLTDLPAVLAKARSKRVSEMREAAEALRELAQSTPAIAHKVMDAGALFPLLLLLNSADPAVAEPAILAVMHLSVHRGLALRLSDCGVVGSLSMLLVRAGEALPCPHVGIQGSVAAALLTLSATLTKTPSSLPSLPRPDEDILRNLLCLAGPASGKDYEGRRDGLKLLLLLVSQPDGRGEEAASQLLHLGAVPVLVGIATSHDSDDVLAEVAGLLLALLRHESGVLQICGVPGAHQHDDAPSQRGKGESLSKGLSMDALVREDPLLKGAGMDALVHLLESQSSPLAQEMAASCILRILSKGFPECSNVVCSHPGIRDALLCLSQSGSSKARNKASSLLEALQTRPHSRCLNSRVHPKPCTKMVQPKHGTSMAQPLSQEPMK